jgi:outer membrane protein OmpA-like peptidoglycan-associated protein
LTKSTSRGWCYSLLAWCCIGLAGCGYWQSTKDFVTRPSDLEKLSRKDWLVEIDTRADGLYIIMPTDHLFEPNEPMIRSHIYNDLNRVAHAIMASQWQILSIQVYADDKGSPLDAQKLSSDRADVLAHALVLYGLDRNRIEWDGYGQREPRADNITPKGRRTNRRAVLILKGYEER